jgi:cell division septation protein DedD
MAKKNNRKSGKPVEEVEQLTTAEQFFESIKPHIMTIVLLVIAGTLGFIAIVFLINSSLSKSEGEWRALAQASSMSYVSGDFNALEIVSTEFADTKAGLWALQMSADNRLQNGVSQMMIDKVAAQQLLEKARDDFQTIVDAPQANKTSMLHRRSLFSLAYCFETMGNLAEANKNYDKLIAEAGDSAFANLALQGFERTADERYAAIFEKFKNYEEIEIGEAPGPELPSRPLIELPPELEAPNNDFVPPADENGNKEPATTIQPAEEKPAEEKPAEEKPAEEKPAEEKPAEEKPAEEKPAEEKPAEEKAATTEGGRPDAGNGKTP